MQGRGRVEENSKRARPKLHLERFGYGGPARTLTSLLCKRHTWLCTATLTLSKPKCGRVPVSMPAPGRYNSTRITCSIHHEHFDAKPPHMKYASPKRYAHA